MESHQQGGWTTLLREVQLAQSLPRCQQVVVPTLKKCPHFMRGRLRQCFAVALRERCRAKGAQDSRVEERARKLFGLVPVMLLHRPRGTGSVGKDELVSRADDFVRGRWTDLLENIRDTSGQPRPAMGEIQEHERRGCAALGRVRQGQVSRVRQELTGAALAPKTLQTLAQLQERRPQERVREIPREVMEFVPDRPLKLDFKLFTKCLQSAPSGCTRAWRLHQRDVANVP